MEVDERRLTAVDAEVQRWEFFLQKFQRIDESLGSAYMLISSTKPYTCELVLAAILSYTLCNARQNSNVLNGSPCFTPFLE